MKTTYLTIKEIKQFKRTGFTVHDSAEGRTERMLSIEFIPAIITLQDYDGFFEGCVQDMVKLKVERGGKFNHHTIKVDAGPYRSSAVSYTSKDGVITLDFYAALRTGFGSLSEQDIWDIIELL